MRYCGKITISGLCTGPRTQNDLSDTLSCSDELGFRNLAYSPTVGIEGRRNTQITSTFPLSHNSLDELLTLNPVKHLQK